MRQLFASATLAGLLLTPAGPLAAETGQEPMSLGEALTRLVLLDLRGDLVSVRYSAGSLQRAAQIQGPFELLVKDFRRWGDKQGRLAVLLLSREEWQDAGFAMPYGLPVRVRGSNVATAAWGDAETIKLWGRLLGWDLPAVEDTPLRSTADESASLVAADLLGLFEGARLLIEDAGYRSSEPWISDLLAHTVAATVVARGFAGGVGEAGRIYRNMSSGHGGAPLALSAYRPGLALEEWLWFQSRFFEAALSILDAEKRGAGKSILKLARKSEGPLTVGALVGRYPGLKAWLDGSFGPTAP